MGAVVSDRSTLFAAHPDLLAPVLQIIHRVIATFLIQQAGVKRSEAATGAIALIQRFGSAANLNIHLHSLVLDGVYRTTGEGAPVFHQAPAPTLEQLQALLGKIITRILITQQRCANAHGFSLHAGVRCDADQRQGLEHLCRYITRPAIANGPRSRVRRPDPALAEGPQRA